MHWIFHKINEEQDRDKKAFEIQRDGRGTSWEINKHEKLRSEELKMIGIYKTEMMYYEPVQNHMLLGKEYRNLLSELQGLFNTYKDLALEGDRASIHLHDRLMNKSDAFRAFLNEFKERVSTFAYCPHCMHSEKLCRDNDKRECQNIIDHFREFSEFMYSMHDVDATMMDTCKGCQYMSIDDKHHLSTGGCLVGKVDKPKIKSPLERMVEADKAEKKEKPKVPEVIGIRNAPATKNSDAVFPMRLPKKKPDWICAHCHRGPGNGKHGADHRICVFEGFNCDPVAWEKASGVKKDD